jgi:trehalose 6-phosphate synthase/phosphatase
MREPGGKKWVDLTERLDMGWMGEVEEVFRYYTEVSTSLGRGIKVLIQRQRTTGSHIELKKSSITWHYRASEEELG